MKANSQRDERPTRIGLFGGTFDPIHRGHEQVAREVKRAFELDCVHLIPCAVPPHKLQGTLTPASDRLEMIRCATAASPHMAASDVEIQRPGPSYTIDTIRHFKNTAPGHQQLFFMMGLDAFLELHTWKEFQRVLTHAALIVMSRPLSDPSLRPLEETARTYVRQYLSGRYRMSGAGDVLRHPDKQPIFLARVTPLEIASTAIRRRIESGEDVRDWIHPAVAQYIDRKGLYR